MHNYLQKILSGQSINYAVFVKKLPEPFRSRHRELFATEKISENRWQVRVLDQEMFAQLQTTISPANSRLHAASQGDSHRHGTGVNFLLAYHHGLTSERPDSIVIADQAVDIGFTMAPSALIIENERNFFHYRQMLAFTNQVRLSDSALSLANCDVLLGSGNRITQAATLEWLLGYERVYCAFDYDAGGLQMFATLLASLQNKAIFVQPDDWQPWLSCFRKTPANTERFTRAISLAEMLNFMPLAQAFRVSGKFMEQEMILDESR